MKDRDIILADLQKEPGHAQSSWDWPADLRFAEALRLEETIKDLKALLKSGAPFPLQIQFHHEFAGKLQTRRTRALRQLVREGLVQSYWLGTGESGRTEFGVSRVRTYRLKERS